MASNPFEDPDVQTAQTSYGGSAYDQPPPTQAPVNNPPIAQHVAGSIEMNVQTNNTNNVQQNPQGAGQKTSGQTNQNLPPPDPQSWIIRAFNWLPIRWFAFLGGLLLITLAIVEIFNKPNFSSFWVAIYLVFFGFVIVFAEAPAFILTRRIQLSIFFWFRLLSRTWGRAWFYLFVAIICFFQDDGFSIFVGIWMIGITLPMFIYSRLAAVSYVRMYIFIASGSEGTDVQTKLNAKFEELDIDRDGKIGSPEIVKLAFQSGQTISNGERHAIQTFLDCSSNGSVSKQDWVKQFSAYNIKQRFI